MASSSSSSKRVGEIFTSAGSAFHHLGELTAQLSSAQHNPGSGAGAAKWSDEEVNMLHRAVTNFANDLGHISERIKSRTVGQIKTAMKKKAFENAGMPLSAAECDLPESSSNQTIMGSKSSADVTLNMLNASENEVDVESLGEGRLDFDSHQ